MVASPSPPRAATSTTSPRVTVRIDPNRKLKRSTLRAPAAETSTTPAAIPV
jgi:hypothetical protein